MSFPVDTNDRSQMRVVNSCIATKFTGAGNLMAVSGIAMRTPAPMRPRHAIMGGAWHRCNYLSTHVAAMLATHAH
jgi:hypothetical protein